MGYVLVPVALMSSPTARCLDLAEDWDSEDLLSAEALLPLGISIAVL